MPGWKSIIPVDEHIANDGGTVKNVFGKYLVDVDNSYNNDWWEWSFKNIPTNSAQYLEKGTLTRRMGYQLDNAAELKSECKQIYDKQVSSLSESDRRKLWGMCSIGRQELVTLDKYSNQYYDMINLLYSIECKSKLVSTRHYTNIWWWTIKKKEFESNALTSQHYTSDKSIMKTCELFYTGNGTWTQEKREIIKICGIPH